LSSIGQTEQMKITRQSSDDLRTQTQALVLLEINGTRRAALGS